MGVEQKAAMIVGPGYEDIEALYPYYRLGGAGINVDVVTTTGAEVKGKFGHPMPPVAGTPVVRKENLKSEDYDLVIIPGGIEGAENVRAVPELVAFTKSMFDSGKVVSSICHGPWVLIEAEIVRGKKATCYPKMKTDLRNAGADYSSDPVVIDGNLITADRPRSVEKWMQATLEVLAAREAKKIND